MPQFRPKLPNLGQRPSADEAETAWRVDSGENEGRLEARDEALAGPSDPAPANSPAASADAARQHDSAPLRLLRGRRRPFLHMPNLTVPSRVAVELAARELLSAPVEAARSRLQNPRELSQ